MRSYNKGMYIKHMEAHALTHQLIFLNKLVSDVSALSDS